MVLFNIRKFKNNDINKIVFSIVLLLDSYYEFLSHHLVRLCQWLHLYLKLYV